MKLSIFYCLLVAVVAVLSRPPDYPGEVQILKYINDNAGNDGFNYEFEQSDGTKVQARGNLVKVVDDGKEVVALVIEGSYSFVNNGVTYTVRYVADQNGYHPKIAVGASGVPGVSVGPGASGYGVSEVPEYPGQPGQPEIPGEPGTQSTPPRFSPLIYASLLGQG